MPVPKVSGLNCPNCGGPIEMRAFSHALTIVCPQCLSVLDAKDPNLQVLQQFEAKMRVQPLIPLGTRGKLTSGTYEVIGFQVRTVEEDGEFFSWQEYLLFNPYKGFRYLTEYKGHWNDVRTLHTLPEFTSQKSVQVAGRKYSLYSTAAAATTFVLGEFPWQVRVGETVQVADYISVPQVLSSEVTAEEVTWSLGEYMNGQQVWEAFKMPPPVPPAYGVFENQPSPYTGGVGSIWKTGLGLLAAGFLLACLISVTGGKPVFQQSITAPASVTPPFDVGGHTSNLQLKTINHTGERLYIHYGLVNQSTARTIDFGREVSPGGIGDVAMIPSVSPGRYYLRVDAEAATGRPVGAIDIQLRRNVVPFGWFWAAAALLIIPPIMKSWRTSDFERQRWKESNR